MDHNHHHHNQPQHWGALDFTRHNDLHNHDYPSPTSPSYQLTYSQPEEYHGPSSSSTDDAQFTQIQPSIGPDRVLTRRQRAAIAQQQQQQNLTRRYSTLPSQSPQDSRQTTSNMYFNMMMPGPSRPQTPIAGATTLDNQDTNATATSNTPTSFSEREHLSLSIAGATSVPTPMRSPQFPLTPASSSSASSSSSGYNGRTSSHLFPTHHSRSNSSSTSTHPRSASPALSVASALTSVSSSTSAPPSSSSGFPANASHASSLQNGMPNLGPNGGLQHPHTPASLAPPRSKQRKQRLFNVDRKAICQYHKDNPNARQEDIAARYGVERSTISKILKNKTKWLNVPEHDSMRMAKHRPSKFPLIESRLVSWLHEATLANSSLSDAMIRAKAKEIAKDLEVGEDKFKASSGWVENFKHRNGIRGGKWLGLARTPLGRSMAAMMADGDDAPEEGRSMGNGLGNLGVVRNVGNASGADMDIMVDGKHDGPGADDSATQHAGGESLALQPAWPTPADQQQTHMSQVPPADLDSAYHHHHIDQQSQDQQQQHVQQHHEHQHQQSQEDMHMHQSTIDPQLQQHPHQHPPSHDSPAVALPVLIQDTPGIYIQTHSGHAIYHQEGPRLPTTPHAPTLPDAEDAINVLITFLDTAGKGIINQQERDALTQVKCALFQAGSGVPYDRGG